MEDKKIIVNKDFNPQIAKSVLAKNWFWPVIFITLTSILAFFYLRYTKPVYESSSTIQIENKDQGREILDLENINSKNNSLSSNIELLRSPFLFRRAVNKLNMPVSIYSKGNVLTEEIYRNPTFHIESYMVKDSAICNIPIFIRQATNEYNIEYNIAGKAYEFPLKAGQMITTPHFDIKPVIDKDFQSLIFNKSNEIYFMLNNPETLVDRLMPGIIINPVNMDAQTVEIKYKSNNALLSRDVVEALTQAFFEYDEILKKKSADNILSFLKSQLDSLSNELKISKDSLTNFQRNVKINDPENIETTLNQNISRLNEDLYVLQSELSTLNIIAAKLNSDPTKIEVYRILPEMIGKSFENSLLAQIQDLHQILERKDELLSKVRPENSEIININARIDAKLKSIRNSISVIQDRYFQNIRLLQGKIGEYEGEYMKLPATRMELNRLKSMQDLNEKYYSILTEKKAQYAISNAGYAPSSRILSPPKVILTPVNPNKKMIYIAFFMLGLLIGTAVILIKYFTFDEINTQEELKRFLPSKANFIGSVPRIREHMEFSQIVVDKNPNSILAEYLRSIRSNLSFIHPNARLIAVTSSISGEGKTFIALNLAGIIALSGKKTIILDLDLRKPKIHLGFDVPNIKGISNLLIDNSILESCIQKTRIPTLDFITSGDIPPNPSELILSNNFGTLIEQLKTIYDVIIIDNPPVGIVSDGIPIIAQADIPIYVFKAGYSKRSFVEKVNELLSVQQINKINIILNNISPRSKRYGYGKNYGHGYYQEEPKRHRRGINFFKK